MSNRIRRRQDKQPSGDWGPLPVTGKLSGNKRRAGGRSLEKEWLARSSLCNGDSRSAGRDVTEQGAVVLVCGYGYVSSHSDIVE
jgi:hypothetical protein